MAPVDADTTARTALQLRGIGHAFGAHRVLDDVTVTLDPGELVAIIGPNGAGKTTLLRVAGGALRQSEGTVSRTPDEVGWVPQHPAVYGKLTVRENLELFAGLEGVDDPEPLVARMLEQTGLTERAGDELRTLSGGNRQRVNIAVGLLGAPAVLLLDEPSSSLDPRQRGRLWEFISSLTDGGTAVLFTTHDVAEAERHADRVIVLVEGRLCYDLPPDALHARAREVAGSADADFETALVALLDATDDGGAY